MFRSGEGGNYRNGGGITIWPSALLFCNARPGQSLIGRASDSQHPSCCILTLYSLASFLGLVTAPLHPSIVGTGLAAKLQPCRQNVEAMRGAENGANDSITFTSAYANKAEPTLSDPVVT